MPSIHLGWHDGDRPAGGSRRSGGLQVPVGPPRRPYLHFEVFERQDEGSLWYKTVPVEFRNTTEPFGRHSGLLERTYEAIACPF